MWVRERRRCLGCGRGTHAVEACDRCGKEVCGQCAERGKCPCSWTVGQQEQEEVIRKRILARVADGGWQTERAVMEAVKGEGVKRAEVKAVITEMVWKDELEDRGVNGGVREHRQLWLRKKYPPP